MRLGRVWSGIFGLRRGIRRASPPRRKVCKVFQPRCLGMDFVRRIRSCGAQRVKFAGPVRAVIWRCLGWVFVKY
jgi:hypothetical protein